MATFQRVDARQQGREVRLRLRAMVPRRARHVLAGCTRGSLRRVVPAKDTRSLGQPDEHARSRTAAALAAVPGGLQSALRRDGAAASGSQALSPRQGECHR